jgi:hypothetical protein
MEGCVAKGLHLSHDGRVLVAYETTERELSVFEKHQLLIARKALTYSDAAAAILGGPTRAEAREIIERITSKASSDAALQSA